MTTQSEPQQQKYIPMTADQLTPDLLNEALAQARRYDRNFANKDGSDAIPVPARMCRLLALAIIHLHNKLQGATAEASPEKGYMASTKAAPTPAVKKTGKAPVKKPPAPKPAKKAKVTKAKPPGPALTEEQGKAFDVVKDILGNKEVVTSRKVAELGGWQSHNSGARHINSLIDLGYLKRVGKNQVIALTGLER